MNKIITDFSSELFTWQTLILISIGLWIYCLIDILKNTFKKNDKTIWILVALLLPFLGPILYLCIGNNKKIKTELETKYQQQIKRKKNNKGKHLI